jgi:hypothetical protein
MANIYINALNSPIHLIRKVKLFILLIFIALNVQYITAVKQTGEHRSLVTIVKQGNGESCHSFLCLFRDTNSQCSNIVLFSDRYVSLTCVRGCSQSMSVKNGGGADTPPLAKSISAITRPPSSLCQQMSAFAQLPLFASSVLSPYTLHPLAYLPKNTKKLGRG